MLGEGSQNPVEQAAIAHVIRNRLNLGSAGGYDDTVRGVVLQPNAFEAWSRPDAPNYPQKFDAKSPEYQAARAIVQGVVGGQITDPTQGFTRFLEPLEVGRRVRSGQLAQWPEWGRSGGKKIGSQVFYPESNDAGDRRAVLGRYSTSDAGDRNAVLERYGTGSDDRGALLARYSEGNAPPSGPPPGSVPTAPQIGTGRTWQTPEEAAAAVQKGREATEEHTLGGLLRTANEALDLKNVAPAVASGIAGNITEGAKRVWNAATGSGNLLPTFQSTFQPPSYDPTGKPLYGAKITDPGRILSGVGGVGEMTQMPAIQQLIEGAATNLGGNPEFGRKASDATGLIGLTKGLRALSPAARGSNAAVETILQSVSPTVRGAAKEALETIPSEELSAGLRRLEANPKLSIADVFPQARQLLQGLAVEPGDWQDFLGHVAKQRGSEAASNVRGAVNEMGVSDQAHSVLTAIIQRAKDTGEKVINPIVKNAEPVPVEPLLKELDKKIGVGPNTPSKIQLQDLRSRIEQGAENGTVKADWLHGVQSRLREDASAYSSSATGSDRVVGRDLSDARQTLVNAIDEHASGYKDALAQYRGDKEVREAFSKGMSFETTRKGEAGILEDSPEAWKAWAKTANKDELDAARAGALAQLQNRVAGLHDATRDSSVPIPKINDISAGKLETLFGKDKAETLMSRLRDERDRASLNQILFGGSQTAQRLKGNEAVKVREVTGQPPSQSGFVPMLAGLIAEPYMHGAGLAGAALTGAKEGAKGARYVAQKMGQQSDIARNQAMARMLVAEGPERDQLLNILRGRQTPSRFVDKLGDLIRPLPLPR